jgi:MFS family permease
MERSNDAACWWHQAWVYVVAGGLIMGLALGIRHATGIFQVPITMSNGWTREAFGFSIAMQNLIWGLAQPFTGMLADRFGSLRVIVAGLIFYAIGLAWMSVAATPLTFTLSAGLCIGVALSGTSFGVIYGALSRMVPPDRRSWALGLAGAVGGFGQFAMVPLTQGLINLLTWSGALVALAVTCAAFLPLALPMRESASTTAVHGPEQTMREALAEAFRHRGFWLLNLGFLACGFQLAFIASHLPAYLLDKGMSGNVAVAGLAIIALSNVAGTYCCGLLGGMYRRKYLLSGIYLVRSLVMALFVLLPLTTWSLYLFCAAMGFIWLGTVPLTNGLVSQVFGVKYITTLFGFVFFGHQLGSFFGVWLGGYMFDVTKSYDLIWFIGIALGVIAALLHFPINDQEVQRLRLGYGAS